VFIISGKDIPLLTSQSLYVCGLATTSKLIVNGSKLASDFILRAAKYITEFETVIIASLLAAGDNVVAAVV